MRSVLSFLLGFSVALGQVVIIPGSGGSAGGTALLPDTVISNSLAVGTNPAQSGIIRIPNNGWITSRHFSGAEDVNVIAYVSGQIHIGASNASGITLNNSLTARQILAVGTNQYDIGSTVQDFRHIYSRSISLMEVLYANRHATPQVGTLANFSDSTVNTAGATVAGGGTFHVLARYNGTNWLVIQ